MDTDKEVQRLFDCAYFQQYTQQERKMAHHAHAFVEQFEPTPKKRRASQPMLDLVHLARQSLGDRDLESDLLRLFQQQATTIMTRLFESPDDLELGADMAHKLKGSARAIGALQVAMDAERYECAAQEKSQKLSSLRAALAQSVSDTDATIEALLK